MKTRVNSRINNVKGKAKKSFRIKVQGFKSESRDKALGYCCHHQVYVGTRMMELKKCYNCPKFVKLEKRGD